MVCCSYAGISYDQPVTKYEVSTCTYYDDMKGNEKCKNWCGLEGLESVKVIGNIII